MKKIAKFAENVFIILSLIMITNLTVKAQSEGTNEIGLRLGEFSGLNFRHTGYNNVGFEFNLLANQPSELGLISGEIEKHFPIGQSFVVFLGGGAYIASRDNYFPEDNIIVERRQAGLEGVAGIDFYIPRTPLNIGFDVRPRFNYLTFTYPLDGGITIRYVFNSH